MIKEFQDWVWKDEKRKKRLETIFENKYSCVRRRIFDGSFLTFPDLSPNITLFHIKKMQLHELFSHRILFLLTMSEAEKPI